MRQIGKLQLRLAREEREGREAEAVPAVAGSEAGSVAASEAGSIRSRHVLSRRRGN